MTGQVAVELGNVQRTMLLPLWGRAAETQKAKPLLVDPTALRIVKAVDYDFQTMVDNLSPLTQLAWIMRSVWTDEVIRGFLAKHPGATIVNVGCGLDTTFDRVDNGALTWYDLDLPDVIDLRRHFILETDRRIFVSASLLEPEWMDQIRVQDNVLFVADGVLYYFEEGEVRAFLMRLADRFPGGEALFDAASPYGVKVANRLVITRGGLDERSFLKWGLKDPRTLSSWDRRLRVLGTYYYFGEKARSLPLNIKLIGAFSDLMKVQYMVHLAIARTA